MQGELHTFHLHRKTLIEQIVCNHPVAKGRLCLLFIIKLSQNNNHDDDDNNYLDASSLTITHC